MPRTAKEIEDSRATLSNTLTITTFIIVTVCAFFLMKKSKFCMDIIEDMKTWVEDDDINNQINIVLSSLVVSAIISLILHYIAYQPLAETSITE